MTLRVATALQGRSLGAAEKGASLKNITRKYMLSKAPWVLLGSMGAGLGNYVALAAIMKLAGEEAAGQYRFLLSVFMALGLFSMIQCNRVVIREVVLKRFGSLRRMVYWRTLFSLVGLLVGIGIAWWTWGQDDRLATAIFVMSFFVPIYFVGEIYVALDQGSERFARPAIFTLMRQAVSVVSALAVLYGTNDAALATCAYVIASSLLAAVICFVELRPHWNSTAVGKRPIRDGVAASVSQMPLDALEHFDKFVLAALVGMSGLAEYAIGIATGRMLFFALKPLQTLLAPRHVKGPLPTRQLVQIGIWCTVLGIVLAAALYLPFIWFYGAKHLLGYQYAAILLCGAGIYSVGQIMLQWAVLNEEVHYLTSTINNIVTPALVVLTLACVYFFWREVLLYAFAASYVVRHVFTILIISAIQPLFRGERDGREVEGPPQSIGLVGASDGLRDTAKQEDL